MFYEFITDDGEVIEARFPMKSAPKLGGVYTVTNGRGEKVKATRIVSQPTVRGDPWRPYVSSRLPRGLEGVKHTPDGKPIIETRAQERDIMAKCGYERE